MTSATATLRSLQLDRQFLLAELDRLAQPKNAADAATDNETATAAIGGKVVFLVPRRHAAVMVPGAILSPRLMVVSDRPPGSF